METKISKYLTLKDATAQGTLISGNGAKRRGIKNNPNASELENIKNVAKNIYDPLREHFGKSIFIESFYRCAEYNKAIKGAKYSQHRFGQAVDLDDDLGGITTSEIFYYIVNNLKFDQIIWEFGDGQNPGWIHVSYNAAKNRNKITLAYRSKGKGKYEHFKTLDDFEKRKNVIY